MGRIGIFWSEFRERRLFHIMVSYLAAGWVALEVIDQFVDRGILSEIIYYLALYWYLGGIFATALIGWNHGEKGYQRAPLSEIVLLSVLLLGTVGVSGSAVSKHRAEQARVAALAGETGMEMRRVAVMYFNDVTRGGELQYLADGLTEDLIEELSRVRTLDVVSRNGVAQFRDADVPIDSVGSVLGAGTIVDGTVERIGAQIRVNLRLVEGASGSDIKRASFERPANQPMAIRDELAQETSRLLREWLGDEIRLRDLASGTQDAAAWARYQRAEKARKDAEALHRRGDQAGTMAMFDRADQLLAGAEALDAEWIEPTVLRGFIAYRRSRLVHSPQGARPWIEKGLGHAERVLARAPRNARALELRGTLRYWQYLLNVTSDPTAQAKLLAQAREDLETAVEQNPALASAHSTLSHLYYREDTPTAVVAAQKAYEEDAYLELANDVLWRLANGSYDIGQAAKAKHWCEEGARRFPDDFRFAYCQIQVMTLSSEKPDIGLAWQLLARQDSLTPPPQRPYWSARGLIFVGGVIGRAGLPDSADAVLRRARARVTDQVDPARELQYFEAAMRVMAGDEEGAIALLKQYAAAASRYSFEHHWWWEGLRGDPRIRALRTTH